MQSTIAQLLEERFKVAFKELGFAPSFPVVLKESNRPGFGDYQVNGVMGVAKALKVNPRDLAEKVIARVDLKDIAQKLEVAGAGFINITLSDDYLSCGLTKNLLNVTSPKREVVVIDYSSPNLAKEMHVGHLRSTIIGDALVRIYEFLGHAVVRRNHVGDWGTQFGMLVAYLLESTPNDADLSLELQDLEEFYRKAKLKFDEDPGFAEKARACVVRLQANDGKISAIWQKFVTVSLRHCQEIYDRLHTKLTPKDAIGESAYNDLLPTIVEDLIIKKVAVESDGAKCVFFTAEELTGTEETPFIVQKQDGAYLYATTDIAAIYDRIKNLQANHLIYVIDARQSLHLKQLFATVKKAQIVDENVILEHVAFGTMLGEDNKPFKTRAGGTIKLMALIDEAVKRANIVVRERNPDWPENKINKLAETLGVAAMKYADLAKNRISDYVFSFDKMLAFEGNTAPYMLYAYVRIISIFKKADLSALDYINKKITLIESEERNLALHLFKFPDRVLEAARESYPHYICAYIYDLAVLFMRFYEACPILQAPKPEIKTSRLALAALTAETLKISLSLLGIETVNEM
jgi:arginyl-tRNA synthetase